MTDGPVAPGPEGAGPGATAWAAPPGLGRDLRRELIAMRLDAPGRLQRLETGYVWVLGALVIGSMGYPLIRAVLHPTTCAPGTCLAPQARGWLTISLAAGLLAGVLAAARALGPLGADPAALTWLYPSPADRAELLAPVLRARVASFAAVGAVLGVVVAIASPAVGGSVLAFAATAGAATSAATVFALAREQAAPARNARHRIRLAVGLFAAVALSGAVATRITTVPAPAWPDTVPAPGTAIGLPLALLGAAAWSVRGRLRAVPARDLARGGSAMFAAQASVLMLDPSVATEAVGRARVAEHGRFASGPGLGRGPLALVAPDLRRLARNPKVVVLALGSAVIPVLLGASAGRTVGVLVAGVSVAVAGRALGGGLTAWTLSTGLRRSIPGSIGLARLALLTGPTLVLVPWALLVCLTLRLPWWGAACFVLAGLSAALRGAEPAKPPDFSMLMTSPMGAIPVGLVGQLIRGFIEALLCVVVLAFTSQLFALTLAFMVFAVVLQRCQWK